MVADGYREQVVLAQRNERRVVAERDGKPPEVAAAASEDAGADCRDGLGLGCHDGLAERGGLCGLEKRDPGIVSVGEQAGLLRFVALDARGARMDNIDGIAAAVARVDGRGLLSVAVSQVELEHALLVDHGRQVQKEDEVDRIVIVMIGEQDAEVGTVAL